MSYETRKLTEIEFPMYFSLTPTPGYNISYLETCEFDTEWDLFHGNWTGSAWEWGGSCWVKGKLDLLLTGQSYCKILSEDIMTEGLYDISEILPYTELEYFNISDEITKSGFTWFGPEDMAEMMIDTRPTYPSSKLTFSIANITKHKEIRFFNIYIDLNWVYDVNLIFEDSKRNSLKPFIF